jgi:5-methylcytosine-specific restriction endonuclease McrA
MSATDEWRARYEAHLASEEWAAMKRALLQERGARCERCGAPPPLELHHKTYERLGRELPSDLELVCPECHPLADEERAEAGRLRSERARYNAGLNTYASKKYGEGWEAWMDPEAAEEEFDEWLESKAEYDE